MAIVTRFLSAETGAISVDYVVLTAACGFVGLAAVTLVSGRTEARTERFDTQVQVWRHGVHASANYSAYHAETFEALFTLMGTLSDADLRNFNAFTNEFTSRDAFTSYDPAWQQYFTDINAAIEAHYAETDMPRPDHVDYDWDQFVGTWQGANLQDNLDNYVGG